MNSEITIAIISLLSAGITAIFGYFGNLVISNKKSREDAIKEAKKQQYQDDRDDYFEAELKIMQKKLDEHNHYAKKFEEVNIRLTGIEKDIAYILKGVSNGGTKKN